MAKIIKQYKNEPAVGKIYQFGIQAPEGSTIQFNGSETNQVIMGPTGIFQAELGDGTYVSKIEVDSKSSYYIDVIAEGGTET